MRQAKFKDRIVTAGPNAPDVATCPDCGGEVRKRKRRRMDKSVTWFYRHKRGAGKNCPRRYTPGS